MDVILNEKSQFTLQAAKELHGITQRFFDYALWAAQNDGKEVKSLEGKKRTLENEANAPIK